MREPNTLKVRLRELVEARLVRRHGKGRATWYSVARSQAPDWHGQYLADRKKALVEGEDSFIGLDELETDLRPKLK